MLRAAVGAPAAAAVSSAWWPAAPAQAAESTPPVDPHDPRFTLAVLPDTQYLFDEGGSDPAPIARNAAEESRGIATLGKPFVLGATQFALSYGHGFYGWIGDTRVVARALRPEQFLRSVENA